MKLEIMMIINGTVTHFHGMDLVLVTWDVFVMLKIATVGVSELKWKRYILI